MANKKDGYKFFGINVPKHWDVVFKEIKQEKGINIQAQIMIGVKEYWKQIHPEVYKKHIDKI